MLNLMDRVEELREIVDEMVARGFDGQNELEYEMAYAPLGGQEELENIAYMGELNHMHALSNVVDAVADALETVIERS